MTVTCEATLFCRGGWLIDKRANAQGQRWGPAVMSPVHPCAATDTQAEGVQTTKIRRNECRGVISRSDTLIVLLDLIVISILLSLQLSPCNPQAQCTRLRTQNTPLPRQRQENRPTGSNRPIRQTCCSTHTRNSSKVEDVKSKENRPHPIPLLGTHIRQDRWMTTRGGYKSVQGTSTGKPLEARKHTGTSL